MKNKFLKDLLFKLITNKNLNQNLRKIYKILPAKNKKRFPFVGIFTYFFTNSNSIKMYSDGSDIIVSSLYWDNKYEYSMTKLWIQLLEKDFNVLDIGANTGYYSLLSGVIAVNGKTFAFEPVLRIHNFLYENININNLQDRVFVNTNVVSDRTGYTDFYVVDSLTLPCGSSENNSFRHGKVPTKIIKVPLNTIDNFVQANDINKIDLIKIDTESTENLVIKGMYSTIKQSLPIIICEILFDNIGKEIEDILSPLGYQFYSIKDDKLQLEKNITFNIDAHNHLFIHKSKIHKIDNIKF